MLTASKDFVEAGDANRYLSMGWFFNDYFNRSYIITMIKLSFTILSSIIIFLLSFNANAIISYDIGLTYTVPINFNGGTFTDKWQACRQAVNAHAKQTARTLVSVVNCDANSGTTSLFSTYTYTQGSAIVQTHSSLALATKSAICPAGATLFNPTGNPVETPSSQCRIADCVAPQVFDTATKTCANLCTPPNVWNPVAQSCANNCGSLKDATTDWFMTSSSGSEQCINNCKVTPSDGNCGFNTAGNQGCYFSGFYTGAPCSGTTTGTDPSTNDLAFQCIKAGKSYGTVNGVPVCTKIGTAGSSPVTQTSSNTKSTSTSTADTKTTSTTTQVGDTVTKMTTTKNADGSETSSTTTSNESSFCEENPNSAICKTSTEQKSSCELDPESASCKHFCEKYPDASACTSAADLIGDSDALLQADVETSIINVNSQLATVTLPQINSCPPDYSVSIGGYSIPFTYTWLCDYASAFKPLVISLALLSASLIIFGSIKQQGT